MKILLACSRCGKSIERYPSKVSPHNFCSRKCLAEYSSRVKNPDGYKSLKDYENMSQNMVRLNKELNPTRMDFSIRAKLSMLRRGSGEGKTYTKSFGVHTHRIIAARMIGRELLPGEIVHHIDQNKRNNRPENLMIFRNQAEHAKWHKEHKGGDAT